MCKSYIYTRFSYWNKKCLWISVYKAISKNSILQIYWPECSARYLKAICVSIEYKGRVNITFAQKFQLQLAIRSVPCLKQLKEVNEFKNDYLFPHYFFIANISA